MKHEGRYLHIELPNAKEKPTCILKLSESILCVDTQACKSPLQHISVIPFTLFTKNLGISKHPRVGIRTIEERLSIFISKFEVSNLEAATLTDLQDTMS